MNQNDYIILFDENGTPFIEHGVFSNLKTRAHKYIDKIQVSNGVWRYFYSQAELDAYNAAKNNTLQAKRDLAMTKKIVAEQRKNGLPTPNWFRRPYDAASANQAVRKAETKLANKEAAEAQAKAAYAKTARGKYDLMKERFQESLHNRKQANAKKQHEKVLKQKAKEQEKIAAEKAKEQEKIAAEKAKADEMQAKIDAANSKHYAYRKKADFKNGYDAQWNTDRKNSEYSDERISKAVASRLQQDEIKSYSGNNSDVLKARKTVEDHCTRMEERKVDLKVAERELALAQARADKAEEAYNDLLSNPSATASALNQINKLRKETNSELRTAKLDVTRLTNLVVVDEIQYKNAALIYNAYLHTYDE